MDPGHALQVCLDGFRAAQMQDVEEGLRAEMDDLTRRLSNVVASDWEVELQRFLYDEPAEERKPVELARHRMWRHQAVGIVAGAAARLGGEPDACPAIPHVPIVPRGVPTETLDEWRRQVRRILVQQPATLERERPEEHLVAAVPELAQWPDRDLAQVMARCYALYVLWWSKAWHFMDLALAPETPAAS